MNKKTTILFFILLGYSTIVVGQSPHYRSSTSEEGIRGCVQQTFQSQVGVSEATGNNDGEVVKYLRAVGFDEGYAWCGAFIYWTFLQCNHPELLDNPRAYAWTPNYMQLDTQDPDRYDAKPGDLILLYYKRLNRVGHVGFVDYWSKGHLAVTVEGNTNEAGVREGDGVRVKYRSKRQIYKVVKTL